MKIVPEVIVEDQSLPAFQLNPYDYIPNEEHNYGSITPKIWSILVFALNIWTLFSTILWFSAKDHPDGFLFVFEVLVELTLFFEALTRVIIRVFRPQDYENLNLYHTTKNDGLWVMLLLVFGSIPIYTIYRGVRDHVDDTDGISLFSRLLAIKILRTFEIWRTLSKIEEILFYSQFKTLIFVKFVINFIYVLLITHVSTCSWLFLETTFSGQPMILGNSPTNPFASGIPYFKRSHMEEASLYEKYADSSVWAVSTLTGCSFGDVTPSTLEEVITSILIFLIGIILLAKIFTDFASIMHLLDAENVHVKEKFLQALKLCRILNIPEEIRFKVHTFYNLDSQVVSQTQYYNEIRELPQTLSTDVMLSLKKKFIGQVNLFSFGPPEFVLMMINYLYPQSSMPGDYIVRVGEYANEMFFIKEGEVEILTTDNQTRIGILGPGAYFGEIGLLLTQKRTVTVRALTLCIFETINKKNFDMIMEIFPHQKEFLLKVAKQRAKVITTEDLEDGLDTPKYSHKGTENSSPYTEETIFMSTKRRFSTFSIYPEGTERIQTAWRRLVETFKTNACVSKGLDFRSTNVIIPTSRFYQLWLFILGLSVFTNQILVPYEIAFVKDSDTIAAYWWVLDVILMIVYLIDIFISVNTSVRRKGMYTSDKRYIFRAYISRNLALDLIAVFPGSYCLNLARMPHSYASWVKLIRFIKIFRFIDLMRDFRKNGERRSRYFQLFVLILFHLTLNHIAACIMYLISMSAYNSGDNCLLKKLEATNIVEMPLVDQSSFVQYVYFLYWACSVSSSGAYGDIAAVAPSEKFFEVISMLFFRIYFAFCAAEVATIVSNAYMSYTENLAKTTTYEIWMRQIKLPDKIINRVKNYNQYLWEKYHGLNENQILDDLPSSTRQEILEFLLFNMLETVEIFPNDEVGLFSNIVKDFKFILVTRDEYIFRAGETVEEIFFIIDGEVKILNQDKTIQLALLGRNDFFGETAIIDGKTGIRTENAKAKTNVTLGILQLSSIRNMWKKYPTLQEKMNKIAQLRRETFKKKSSGLRLETEEWILKDTGLNEKQEDEIVNHNPSLVKTEQELEFDQLRQDLVDVLGEPDPPSRAYPTLMKISVNNSPKRQTEMLDSPQLLFDGKIDGNMKQKSRSHPHLGIRGEAVIQDISKLTYRSIAISSKSDLAVIAKTIEANETEPNEDKGLTNNVELEETAKINKGFIESKIEPSVHRKFSDYVWQVTNLLVCLEDIFRKLRISILNIIVLFEWFYRPLNLALDLTNFKGPMVILEVSFMLIFILNLIIDLKDYQIQRKIKQIFPSEAAIGKEAAQIHNEDDDEDSKTETKRTTLSRSAIFLDLLYIVPCQMIITLSNASNRATNVFLIIIQFTRLLASGRLRKIFQISFFKKRYALGNILLILIAFTILNHFSACIFIVLAKARSDFNTTWLAKIPAPQFNFPFNPRTSLDTDNYTIYQHALYWAYVTTSHVGVGDVTAVNSDEKIYATILIIATTFLYAFLFGNLASMVDDLTPKFQREFESHYWKVLEYAKLAKLESFVNKIHAYYSYIWQTTKGVDENNILKALPNSLKSDIFLARYNEIVTRSKFFHDEHGVTDLKVFYSFSKKFKYGTFMKHDFIITVGQEINDIYIILEGSAEVITYNFNSQKHKHLGPGDYFGGVFANMTQIQNIMASEITKVAILPQSDFFQLKEAFPTWFHNIIKEDKMYQIGHKLLTNLRKLVHQRKNNIPTSRAFHSSNASSRLENDLDQHKLPNELKIETVVSLSSSPMSLNQKKDIEDFESGHNRVAKDKHLEVPSVQMLSYSSTNPKEVKNLSSQFSPTRASVFKTGNQPNVPSFNLSISPTEKRSSWMPRLSIFNQSKKRASIADSDVLTQEKNKEMELSQKRRMVRKDVNGKPLVANAMESSEIRKSVLMGQNQPEISAFVRMPTFMIHEEENENNQSIDQSPDTPESVKKSGIVRRITLRKNSVFMARSQENKFMHVMDLKKKLNQHLQALRFYIEPDSKWNNLYEFVHLIMIIYSLFAIPIYACFDVIFDPGLITVEVVIFLEQIAYIVLSARTAQFAGGALTLDNKIIWRKLSDKGILIDILSTVPFNLIFGSTSTKSPLLLIAILKLNRILLLLRFPSQLTIFTAKYPKIGKYVSFIKPAFYLVFSSHFIACLLSLLFRLEPTENYNMNFIDYLELSDASITRQYIIFLTFMLSVATTTGYDELVIYNNYERSVFIFCIYLGDAVLALVLGWFASSSSTLSDKYAYTFDKIRKIDAVLHQEPIPKKVKDRIISCFSYLVDNGSDNKSCLDYLSGLLPETILKDMTFQQTSLFHNFPLIQEFRRNRTLINEIVANLKLRIYLPKDYIIMRNDFGSQVFCIAKGTVYILSPSSEKKVLGVLKPGDFFGELAVYTTTKRLTSFLAQTFCIVYVLEKDVLKNILKAFPHANFEFKLFAKERIEAYTKDMKAKEGFHKNYSFLRTMSIKKTRPTKTQVKKVLKSSEVPRFVLPEFEQQERSPGGYIKFKRLQSSAAVHFKKEIKIEENISALDSSFSDYVEEEEIQFRHLDNKKKSFRANYVAKERRFSRMKRGKEKTMAKVNGVIVKWGFDFN